MGEQEGADHGRCVSLKKYKSTGCSGICGSSVKATLGSGMITPSCKCCQPTNVKKHNVTLKCADKTVMHTTFYEILSCSCERTTCASSFNANKVNVQGDTTRSLFDEIDNIQDMDDDTLQLQRKSLLNDLALIHAKKKKK